MKLNESTLNYKTDPVIPYDSATLIVIPDVITLSNTSSVTDTSVIVSGNIADTGGVSISTRGFAFRVYDTIQPTIVDSIFFENGSFGNGNYSLTANGLLPATHYKYSAYAQNQAGTGYGSAYDFYTFAKEPKDNPNLFEATAITQNEVRLNISPAINYPDLEGYLILMNINNSVNGTPQDGIAYNVGNSIGNSNVVAIIDNPVDSIKIITNLNASNNYYFEAIPFNWDGVNNPTINYFVDITNLNDTARTVIQPEVYTLNEINQVTESRVGLKGNIINTGGEAVSSRGFVYLVGDASQMPDFTDFVQQRNGAYQTGIFNDSLNGLQPASQYAYRAFAINSVDTVYGRTYDFYTLSQQPQGYPIRLEATTSSTTQIDLYFSPASSVVNAEGYLVLQKQGGAPNSIPQNGQAYTIGNTIDDGLVAAIIPNKTDSFTSITSVSPGNTYYYTIIPFNFNGNNSGTYHYLTSGGRPVDSASTILKPELRIDQLSYITGDTVRFNTSLSEINGSPAVNLGIAYQEYSIPGQPDTSGSKVILNGNFNKGNYNIDLGGLLPETRYKARAFATNAAGTGYSMQSLFYSLSLEPLAHAPYFDANASSTSQIDLSYTKLSNLINADGYIILQALDSFYLQLPQDGHNYSVGSQLGNAVVAAIVNDTQSAQSSVTNVLPGTEYYFWLIPYNWDNVNASTINYFTDPQIPRDNAVTISSPFVSTLNQIDNVNSGSAQVYGNISDLNGSSVFERGFAYKYYQSPGDPELTDLVVMETGQYGTGNFQGLLNNLTPGRHYKYRAYATNLAGTSFGNTRDFYSLSLEPSIHVQTFNASAFSSSQIDLVFDPISNYSDVEGYLIIQSDIAQPDGIPQDANTYSIGSILGNGQVMAVITNKSKTSLSITALSANTKYYYSIIPFNWNKQNAETYNYLTSGAISYANATTRKPCSISSELVANGPTTLCVGSEVRLSVEFDTSYSYSWTRNNELVDNDKFEYFAHQDGVYKVFISNDECNVVTNIITINHYPDVKPIVYGQGKIEPCSNDSMKLSTVSYDSYLWSTDETSQEIFVKTSGDYWVEVVNEYGCRVRSEDFVVNSFCG
jgi:hypothetical protein